MSASAATVESMNAPGQVEALLQAQRAAFQRGNGKVSLESRLQRLNTLEQVLLDNRIALADAISADFGGRARQETMLELFVVLDDIRHARRNLKAWMKPRRTSANWQFLPSKARLLPQPLGVIGIIGAYNYPVMTALSPAVSAIAAGNHVVIKPAGMTPTTCETLAEVLNPHFDADEFVVLSGDKDVAKAMTALPWDHLVFTGSTRVGKLVMRSASEHLVPVTLELGGKCPVIIGDDYDIQKAAASTVQTKFLNAGQTCVTCDYALVPEERLDEFLGHAEAAIRRYYPSLVSNPDYTRVAASEDWQRLQQWVEEARSLGANVLTVNPQDEPCSADNRVFAPTLISHCPPEAQVVREEIFGPVFPVLTYRTLDEAIDHVNLGERPLASYYFGHRRKDQDRVLTETISGGVTINGCANHAIQHNLPFGGVGASGIGHYHGQGGFDRFSHIKPVLHLSPLAKAIAWLRPPYGNVAAWILGFMLHNRVRKEML